jgi:predicted metal-binding membrane protein
MFGIGVSSAFLMFALGGLTAVEKNLPWGRRLSRPLGVLLVVVAVGVVSW